MMVVDTTMPVLDDPSLDSALAALWQKHRQASLDKISLIETATANVLRSEIDDDAITEATTAAHQLAGSLGIFGFDEGSRAALEAEHLFRQPVIDSWLLAEAVMALRASVHDGAGASVTRIDRTPPEGPTPGSEAAARTVRVVSLDAQLISRLTVEAAAIGLSVIPSAQLPGTDLPGWGFAAVIIDQGPGSTWSRPDLLASVAATANRAAVVVLTERDSFEERAAFAGVSAAGIMPRSQDPGQTVAFLAESVARRQRTSSTVISLNATDGIEDALSRALAGSECHLDVRSSAAGLWEALDEQGADLVVVGFAGTEFSGPDVCRMIRAHPRWHRLPVVIIGGRSRSDLDASFSAGADDYLHAGISSHDLGVRLQNLLTTRKLYEIRSDSDTVAGTENRPATERSLDRLFRFALGNDELFTLVLVTIDRFEEIRATEGSAVGHAVLRWLGTHLVEAFRGEDIVGRWTEDGFAVGVHGAQGQDLPERIARVLDALAVEGISTTSGHRAHYTFSAAISSAPADGSSLASLERVAETALLRSRMGENTVVKSGERPRQSPSDLVDVVVVEDDDAMADIIEHALSLRQYEFIRFGDGAEAAAALGEGTVRAKVVLLDVGLPSLDGFGVLRVLRSKGVLDGTRVIMLTARSSEAEVLRGIGLGATEHIAKPFSIPVLLARLDQTEFEAVR
jgi:diguanylate cyclase (GGDEF)-like protein